MITRICKWVPIRARFHAVTWPPFGVFIKRSFWVEASLYQRRRVLRHEAVHWQQYQDRGLIRFYWDYITLRIRYGYENHPMEIEAREASK